MWKPKKGLVTEALPKYLHHWEQRENLKDASNFNWQQKALHAVEDCLSSACRKFKNECLKACYATKKLVKQWWQDNSPSIGLKVAAIALIASIAVTDVAQKLGG